jgi:hypothetical protein
MWSVEFTFDLDGPVFANYMRDQLESYLRDKGELPLNLRLDSSRTYQQMTGQGEILLDERGLPLRLTIHLVYPPDKDNKRVEADITTDFGFDIGDLGLGIGQSRSSRVLRALLLPPHLLPPLPEGLPRGRRGGHLLDGLRAADARSTGRRVHGAPGRETGQTGTDTAL